MPTSLLLSLRSSILTRTKKYKNKKYRRQYEKPADTFYPIFDLLRFRDPVEQRRHRHPASDQQLRRQQVQRQRAGRLQGFADRRRVVSGRVLFTAPRLQEGHADRPGHRHFRRMSMPLLPAFWTTKFLFF